jgi:FkbM family methyltransferase
MSISTTIVRLLVHWLRKEWRGLGILHRCRHTLGGRPLITIRTNYGNHVALNPLSYIDRIVLQAGYYESEVIETMRPHLGGGAVLWDIGANIGLHAVTAKFLSPETRVIAFEPSPAMLDRIAENQALSSVEIEVCPIALGAKAHYAQLHVSGEGNPGMTTLKPWSEAQYESTMSVWCDRADGLVARGELPEPTLAKIDVEGTESEVLDGFGELLHRQSLKLVIFEAEPGLDEAQCDHPLAAKLRAAGFVVRVLPRREQTAHNLDNYAAERLAIR